MERGRTRSWPDVSSTTCAGAETHTATTEEVASAIDRRARARAGVRSLDPVLLSLCEIAADMVRKIPTAHHPDPGSPRDMTTTVVEGETKRWMTRGRDDEGGTAAYRDWPNLPATGAIRSNAEDMLKFVRANVGPPESRLERVMRDAQEPRANVGEGLDVALHWQVRTFGDRTIVMHGGATQGFTTRVAFDPDAGVGMVLLTNTAEFDDDGDEYRGTRKTGR